jgi:sulfite exporter TauE/SafE
MEAGLLAALLGGLVGSVHCFGMCGGIAGALGVAGGGKPSLAFAYSAGRIASYAVAGAVAGAIGAGIAGVAGLGPWLRLVMGLVLVLLGLQVAINLRLLAPLEAAGARLWRGLAPVARRFVPPRHAGQALALGALWGWLPCGLVYGMLAAAAGTGGAADGALFMAVFGLGTAPAMVGLAWASGRGGSWLTARRRRAAGWLLVLFGAWTAATPLMHMAGRHGHGEAHSPGSPAHMEQPAHGEPHEHHRPPGHDTQDQSGRQ